MLPYRSFGFRVEIQGLDAGGFSEVTGFDATFDVVEYREGNYKENTPRKLPGLMKYGNVVLKWGTSSNMVLYNWLQDIYAGKVEQKTVTITVQNNEGDPAPSWQLVNAWPVKYTSPDLNATASEVAFESIELAHEGLTRIA